MSARRQIIPVFVPHLGCPHDCVFCDQRRISGTQSPVGRQQVIAAIEEAKLRVEGFKGAEIAFYGGSFTAVDEYIQEELLSCVRPYLKDGTLGAIRLSTRPDAVDEDVIERLKRYNVGTVELGAQSMVDEVLIKSERGHTSSDVEKASALIKNSGIKLILQMMTGLPGDSDEGAVYTAQRIASIKPDGVRIYPTVIVEDTRLEKMWRAGEYAEHTVEDAVRVCAKLLPIFENADISVIRLGLNPTEDLSGGMAVGGAYHPALGEMVRSRILLDKARKLLDSTAHGENVVFTVPKGMLSAMIGQHRCNINTLCSEYSLLSVKVKERPMPGGDVELEK